MQNYEFSVLQGLFITSIGAFGGMQARNIIVFAKLSADTVFWSNLLLRNETAALSTVHIRGLTKICHRSESDAYTPLKCNNFSSSFFITVHCVQYPHNYKWQNGKECKGKTNYAQSALARLVRQNFLAGGRLTSSPPPPPPPSRSGTLPTTPIPYPYIPIGAVCGWSQSVWGRGEREQSSSISRFLGNSGALSALKQIVHILSSLERLFHSVISNSVAPDHLA